MTVESGPTVAPVPTLSSWMLSSVTGAAGTWTSGFPLAFAASQSRTVPVWTGAEVAGLVKDGDAASLRRHLDQDLWTTWDLWEKLSPVYLRYGGNS